MTLLSICDTETTGLDPDRHEIWEVALIQVDIADNGDVVRLPSRVWQLPVDLGRADPVALSIGGFYDRRRRWPLDETPTRDLQGDTPVCAQPTGSLSDPMPPRQVPVDRFATIFAELTHGSHLIGAVPSFDDQRLAKLLRANGACPGWHYQPIDVETYAAGWLQGIASGLEPGDPLWLLAGEFALPPWDSNELSRAVGVDPDWFDRHTALGDCEWALAIWNRCHSVMPIPADAQNEQRPSRGASREDRDPACVERWPGCDSGLYDPRCCRWPKSCSCTMMTAADR